MYFGLLFETKMDYLRDWPGDTLPRRHLAGVRGMEEYGNSCLIPEI
jgi:hypothetical protein